MPEEILRTLKTNDPNKIILNIEKRRFLNRIGQFRRQNPRAAVFLGGLSGLSFLYSFYLYSAKSRAQAEIEFRKSQLAKPVYDLTGSSNIPWSSRNLDEWKYRQVTVRGRPIHAKQALIPTKHVGMNGFECIVPLVMSEKEDGSDQHGVMLSLGFIPQEYAHPSMRYKVESSDWQTFTAYVSTLDELQAHGTFTNGNKGGFENVGEGCWNYADLEHIAKQSGLTNWKSSKHAILEQVNPNTEKDERSRVRRDHDSSFQQDLPYAQTICGALQTPKMPWDYQNEASFFNGLGGLFGGIAAVLFAGV